MVSVEKNNEKLLWSEVEEYINKMVVKEPEYLKLALKNSLDHGLPSINVQPPVGKLMNILIKTIAAERSLEIGVLGGYSGIWIASALPENGSLIGLEKSKEHVIVAKENIKNAGIKNINIIEGDAKESLHKMIESNEKPFDFILIDADKKPYADYFKMVMQLSHSGSIIFIDNMVWRGEILKKGAMSEDERGIVTLYEDISHRDDIDGTVIQTVGSKDYDGFALLRVK
jgi:caffeoyl-CoA O-methyltransferase